MSSMFSMSSLTLFPPCLCLSDQSSSAAASRKMEVCFDLFDLNSDGFISGADLAEMLCTVVRLNRHHREVSESNGGERPSMELEGEPKDEKEAELGEQHVGFDAAAVTSTIAEDELLEIVRSQLTNLGKTMTDNDISFKDFCDIVNSHPQILSAMQLNTSEGSDNSRSSAGMGALDFENVDSPPRRRRASTATF